MINKELLKIICCPNCKGDLTIKESKLICNSCKKEYLIKDNIPILLNEKI